MLKCTYGGIIGNLYLIFKNNSPYCLNSYNHLSLLLPLKKKSLSIPFLNRNNNT